MAPEHRLRGKRTVVFALHSMVEVGQEEGRSGICRDAVDLL